MDIQKYFKDIVLSEQFEFLKIDLARQTHCKDCYREMTTQIAWKYFLVGFNAALEQR